MQYIAGPMRAVLCAWQIREEGDALSTACYSAFPALALHFWAGIMAGSDLEKVLFQSLSQPFLPRETVHMQTSSSQTQSPYTGYQSKKYPLFVGV